MRGCLLLLLMALGCASPTDAGFSAICPDGARPSIDSADDWVTIVCESEPGVPNGPAWSWIDEGRQLLGAIRFRDGKLHGPARHWHANGRLWSESFYVDGSNEGAMRMWHDNGRLQVLAHYRDDVLEGAWIQWRPDGSLRLLRQFRAGDWTGPFLVWHPNGRIKTIGRFWSDRKVGTWSHWSPKGELQREEEHGSLPASAE